MGAVKFGRIAKFLQLSNFPRLRNFLPDSTIHPVATVHLAHCSSLLPLFTYAVCLNFCLFVPLLVFFLFCPHCNSVCYVILVISKGGLAIQAPKTSIVKRRYSPVIKFWAGFFPLLSFSPIFFPFLLFSRLTNTPLRMTTQRMVG